MKHVLARLEQRACEGLLAEQVLKETAVDFNLDRREVERLALEQGFLPARYQRNRSLLACEDQLRLFGSTVAVVGCGGLGGHVIEQLARLGVGQLLAIDPDSFEEHNLNRQLLSLPGLLGRSKAEAATRRVEKINPAVICHPFQTAFERHNGKLLLTPADAVVDAVDNLPTRLQLARCCEEMELPLVHGAIEGWYGQVATQFPGDRTVERIYQGRSQEAGMERSLGNPAFTPAVVASLQTAEICKVLLGKGECLRERMAVINLLEMQMEQVALPELSTVEATGTGL